MVRQSSKPSVRRRYPMEDLEKAVKMVEDEGTSLTTAAKICRVPLNTLCDKVKKRSTVYCRLGRKSILREEEEKQLVVWITKRAKRGNPCTILEVRLEVKNIIDRDSRFNPFTDNLPGKSWLLGFISRHSETLNVKKGGHGRQPAVIVVNSDVNSDYSNMEESQESGSSQWTENNDQERSLVDTITASEKATSFCVIESMMKEETLHRYKEIYLLGNNLPADELYNIWKQLKQWNSTLLDFLPVKFEAREDAALGEMRQEDEGEMERKRKKKEAKNKVMSEDAACWIEEITIGQEDEGESEMERRRDRKRKKKEAKNKAMSEDAACGIEEITIGQEDEGEMERRRDRKRKKKEAKNKAMSEDAACGIEEITIGQEDEGESEMERKRKKKEAKNKAMSEGQEDEGDSEMERRRDRKRKKREKQEKLKRRKEYNHSPFNTTDMNADIMITPVMTWKGVSVVDNGSTNSAQIIETLNVGQ